MENYENKRRKNEPQLKKKDKIWLNIKNLKTIRLNKKLDYVKVGLFKITDAFGPVNYRFKLPINSKIYPVFHIFLLEKALNKTPVATTFDFKPQKDNVYEVEKILKEKNNQFLIK